jgi:2-dehydro-3-deoxyphosphogluconate aldolase/(4S)-4-hydroxy-2-oxoglutarate aldolase
MTNSRFEPAILDRVARCGVLAVLVLDDAAHAAATARALLDGGVDAMELTLRTDDALAAIRAIRRETPEMLVGAGTVLTAGQVGQVAEAGAEFAVSPGVNPAVLEAARRIGLPFAPGVATPTDVETALALGCRELKFFPAEPSGGLNFLRSMAAPYAHLGVRFVPLGGVNVDNLAAYLQEPLVLAVGGSWLAPKNVIAAGNWDEITARAAEARRIVESLDR